MTDGVDAVLFDLDDTICTYRRSAEEILSIAFDRLGVERFFDGEEYVERLGEFDDVDGDIRDVRATAFGRFAVEAGHDRSVGERVADIYTDERDQSNVRFLEGADRALSTLDERYPLGLVTNGDPWMQTQKLEALGISDTFDVVVHGGHDAPYKPDPEPFHVALSALDVAADRTVHIGNSLESDVTGARAAGLRAVWVANGNDVTDPEPTPHHVIDSTGDAATEPWR